MTLSPPRRGRARARATRRRGASRSADADAVFCLAFLAAGARFRLGAVVVRGSPALAQAAIQLALTQSAAEGGFLAVLRVDSHALAESSEVPSVAPAPTGAYLRAAAILVGGHDAFAASEGAEPCFLTLSGYRTIPGTLEGSVPRRLADAALRMASEARRTVRVLGARLALPLRAPRKPAEREQRHRQQTRERSFHDNVRPFRSGKIHLWDFGQYSNFPASTARPGSRVFVPNLRRLEFGV
jgi:hypothetical protein